MHSASFLHVLCTRLTCSYSCIILKLGTCTFKMPIESIYTLLVFGFLFEVEGSDLISLHFILYIIIETLSIYWHSTGSYTLSNKVVRGIIFLAHQPYFFVRATPFKPLHRISWNFLGILDTMCRFAYYQGILVALFYGVFWPFWTYDVEYSNKLFVSATPLQSLHEI